MAEEINTTQEEQDEGAVYELGYHLLGTTPTEQVAGAVADVKALIEKHGGIFISEEFPQLIRLAYTIIRRSAGGSEKHDMAHFGSIKFEMSPAEVVKLKEDLEEQHAVLRFIITRTVREDTRAPRRALGGERRGESPEPSAGVEAKTAPATPKPTETGEPMSEADLDKTIEELVKE